MMWDGMDPDPADQVQGLAIQVRRRGGLALWTTLPPVQVEGSWTVVCLSAMEPALLPTEGETFSPPFYFEGHLTGSGTGRPFGGLP